MANFDSISDLQFLRDGGRVYVKVLRRWISRDTRFLLLVDETGAKIEATIYRYLHDRDFYHEILEHGWYEISNFDVSYNVGLLHLTRNEKRIIFTLDTIVTPTTRIPDTDFTAYADFNQVKSGDLIGSPAFDLIGAIVRVVRAPTYTEFYMQDVNNAQITCWARDRYCDQVLDLWRNRGGADHVICVLRFWRVAAIPGFLCVTSIDGPSEILVNPSTPEVDQFRSRFKFEGVKDEWW